MDFNINHCLFTHISRLQLNWINGKLHIEYASSFKSSVINIHEELFTLGTFQLFFFLSGCYKNNLITAKWSK